MINPPHIKPMPWWQILPAGSGLVPRAPGAAETPAYAIGTLVRLQGKPDRLRRIIEIQWHSYRWVYVYVVETSTSDRRRHFKPYWFQPQLTVENLK